MSNIISADVSDDLKDRIEAAREKKGDGKESRSATVKRLIRRGLNTDTDTTDTDTGDGIGIPYVAILFGAMLIGIAITPVIEPAYLMIMGVSLLATGVLASRWGDD